MKGNVNIHSTPDKQNDVIATVGNGVKGYVIEQGEPRTLVLSGGKIGYISNMYITVSELDAKKYPKKLKDKTAANAGEKVDL